MKRIFFVLILMSITVFSFANNSVALIAPSSNELINPVPESDPSVVIVNFQGELIFWETQAGALIIDCDPPYLEDCYTLIWSLDSPGDKTVILNDANQTELSVTSNPSITTDPVTGTKTHTFTR